MDSEMKSSANDTTDRKKISESRQKIVNAALEEFADHGLDGARVWKIAENAGVSKSAIFYYFSTKKELYREVVREFLRLVSDELDMRIPDTATFEDILHEMIHAHSEIIHRFPSLAKIIRRQLADPQEEFMKDIAETFASRRAMELMETKFREEVESGRLRNLDFVQTMTSFNSMSLAFLMFAPIVEALWDNDEIDSFLKERKQTVVDLFLNGVRFRPESVQSGS